MTAAPDLLSRLRRTVATLTADYAEHHAETCRDAIAEIGRLRRLSAENININLKAALKLKSDRLAEAERKLAEAEEDYGALQSTARVAESRAETAERELAKLREALAHPTPEMIEAGCREVYGKTWNGPPEKMPGENMKEVWRNYARRFWAGMTAAALQPEEPTP